VAQAVFKKQSFKRAETELALTRNIDRCGLLNWSEPEYPQTLLQIYDPQCCSTCAATPGS
jgi:hypothetical protein